MDMSRLLHPEFWSPRQKPGVSLRRRQNHPLAAGMIRAWVPNQAVQLVDLIAAEVLTPGSTFAGIVAEDATIALRPGSTANVGTNGLKSTQTIPYAANGTIIVRACSKVALGAVAPFILDDQAGSNRTLIYRSGTTTNKWGWYLGGTAIFDTGSGEITDLFDHAVLTTVAFTWTSGNVQNVYKNGVLFGASPYGVTAAPVAQTVTIGDRFGGVASTTGLGGPIEYIYFYDRALSGDEVRAQFDEPFSMWEPAEDWPEPGWSVAAASGQSGAAAQTLSLPTNTTTGKVTHPGAAAQNTVIVTQAATGKVGHVGEAAQTLSLPTQAAEGIMGGSKVGAAAQTLSLPTQATTGLVGHPGASAQSLGLPVNAASGKVGHIGAAAQTLSLPIQNAEGPGGSGDPPAGGLVVLQRRRRRF